MEAAIVGGRSPSPELCPRSGFPNGHRRGAQVCRRVRSPPSCETCIVEFPRGTRRANPPHHLRGRSSTPTSPGGRGAAGRRRLPSRSRGDRPPVQPSSRRRRDREEDVACGRGRPFTFDQTEQVHASTSPYAAARHRSASALRDPCAAQMSCPRSTASRWPSTCSCRWRDRQNAPRHHASHEAWHARASRALACRSPAGSSPVGTRRVDRGSRIKTPSAGPMGALWRAGGPVRRRHALAAMAAAHTPPRQSAAVTTCRRADRPGTRGP